MECPNIWIISIDLRKAFDRVEQNVLFRSLERQGFAKRYIVLLKLVYRDQTRILMEICTSISSEGCDRVMC